MSGNHKNFNDSPVPGLNQKLDLHWVESVARSQLGFSASSRWTEGERVAGLLALILMDCSRTNAIALQNAAKTIADAIREAAPKIGAGLASALQDRIKGGAK